MKILICGHLVAVVIISLFLFPKTRCSNGAEEYGEDIPFDLIEYLTNDAYGESDLPADESSSRGNGPDFLIGDVVENMYSENMEDDDSFYSANYNMANLGSNPLNNASEICPAYNSEQSEFASAEEGQYDHTRNVIEEAPQDFPLEHRKAYPGAGSQD